MNSDTTSLEISLQAIPSKLRITGGKEIPLNRAILALRNIGQSAVDGLVPHATLSQEGGSVQDVTEPLSRAMTANSIPPGEELTCDMYDLLLAAHPGVASKVHLWGYKAILNWWFDLSVWAEYGTSDSAAPAHTPVSRWKLRWIMGKADAVDVSIEAVKD